MLSGAVHTYKVYFWRAVIGTLRFLSPNAIITFFCPAEHDSRSPKRISAFQLVNIIKIRDKKCYYFHN